MPQTYFHLFSSCFLRNTEELSDDTGVLINHWTPSTAPVTALVTWKKAQWLLFKTHTHTHTGGRGEVDLMSCLWRAWRITFFIIMLCTHRAMQIRESQATLKETCEFTFLPAFQKKSTLHSGSGKWSKIRDDNRAKILCQLKKEEGLM